MAINVMMIDDVKQNASNTAKVASESVEVIS